MFCMGRVLFRLFFLTGQSNRAIVFKLLFFTPVVPYADDTKCYY